MPSISGLCPLMKQRWQDGEDWDIDLSLTLLPAGTQSKTSPGGAPQIFTHGCIFRSEIVENVQSVLGKLSICKVLFCMLW